jgi:hypothetical protein
LWAKKPQENKFALIKSAATSIKKAYFFIISIVKV